MAESATPLRFTEEFRLAEVERGRRSLFYFNRAILGYDWQGPLQAELCDFLEGRPPHHPWKRAVVSAYRGSLKSTTATRGYVLWRGLYVENFITKLVGNSSENVKQNHFLPMIELFVSSRRADYLQWLYQGRLPEGFRGWSNTQIQFVRSEPHGAPSITYWGLESKFEGWHGDLLVIDDPEGADADRSDAPNRESRRLWAKGPPLARVPKTFQQLLIGTPHGPRPVVYYLRDREANGSLQNAERKVKVFWREVLDETGAPREPHRFSDDDIELLKLEPETWHSQYMLGRPGELGSFFDYAAIERYAWDWADARRTAVRYRALSYDREALGDPERDTMISEQDVTVSLSEMRFFLHLDPKHKLDEQRRGTGKGVRPSEAAAVVCAVAPDNNALVFDYWAENAGLEGLLEKALYLFERYEVHQVTYEDVGAQAWLRPIIEMLERRDPRWSAPRGHGFFDGVSRPLPRLSQRLVEHPDTNEVKEQAFRTVLAAYLNTGALHTQKSQTKLAAQIENALNEDHAVDLLDAIVQGPGVWSPPPEGWLTDRHLFAGRRRALAARVGPSRTGRGYASPFSGTVSRAVPSSQSPVN